MDSWVTLGLEFAMIAVALLIGSRAPERAIALVWTVMGLEVGRGIVTSAYMMVRGHDPKPHVIWIVIHSVVVASGLFLLGRIP